MRWLFVQCSKTFTIKLSNSKSMMQSNGHEWVHIYQMNILSNFKVGLLFRIQLVLLRLLMYKELQFTLLFKSFQQRKTFFMHFTQFFILNYSVAIPFYLHNLCRERKVHISRRMKHNSKIQFECLFVKREFLLS